MGCFTKKTENKDTAEDIVGPELLKVLPQTELPWYRTKHLLLLNLMLLVPLLSSSAVGYDGSMMNGLQTLPQWRNFFNHPPPPLLGAINAVYPVCKILGLVPASTISDKFGRKVPIYIGLVSLVIGPAIQASSINLPMFIVSRGLIGFATVFPQVACPILVSELSYPTHRGKMTALYNTFFYFGAIAAAWITYGTFKMQSTWAWRCPSALQAAIPFLQLMFIYWVPESPRWLIANGRKDQAIAILTKFHAGGQENSPLVAFEITEIENALALERSQESSASWKTLIMTAPMRRRTLIAAILGFFSQWNGIGVVTYYLSLVLDTIGITEAKHQVLINGLLQLFNFAAAVFAGALMVDRFGRRRLFLVATSGLCLSYVAWTALTSYFIRSHDEAAGRTVVAFIFIAFFFYDIAWTPLPQAYTIEIFPFLTRSRGLTTALTSSYLGLISAQLINPVGLAALGWKYYIVFCCILACLIVVIYFLFPETKGRSLEQITELFEGRSVSVDAEEIISKGKVGVVYEIETPNKV
ncbi:lactose permease [Fusarium mexicanum]|uniref:Lactose permease n=1 Tax=Fusarium mexicanum TaxID=751941 RepID=A0A8H5I3F1_9HYPO|nr:lactose permease [Fusarium mexicanum]